MKKLIDFLTNKTVITIISIVLFFTAILFAWLIVVGIKKPIDYQIAQEKRFERTINRLKDIREAQKLYKDKFGHYTPSFDSLISFIKCDSLKIINAVGSVPDVLTEDQATTLKLFKGGKYKPIDCTETYALKLGLITRDTIKVSIRDSVFKNLKYPIDSMRYIPVGRHTAFIMDTASVMTGSGVVVKVYQCYTMYDDVLEGLDKQLTINLKSQFETFKEKDIYGWKVIKSKDEKNNLKDTTVLRVVGHGAFLRLGKLNEANNNSGNWE